MKNTKPMKIEILSRAATFVYTPQERIYGIRIGFNGEPQHRQAQYFKRLEEHPLYIPNFYAFDDTEPWMRQLGEIPMSEDIATSILQDFQFRIGDAKTLLVCCYAGQGRSPAVATALNHIFDLGNSSRDISLRYPNINLHVARTLMQVAKKISLNSDGVRI